MLVTPPFGASSNIALWRAYSKPPVELVVADLDKMYNKVEFLDHLQTLECAKKVMDQVILEAENGSRKYRKGETFYQKR